MLIHALLVWLGQTSDTSPALGDWIPVGTALAGVAGALTIWWRYWRPALENQRGRIEQLEKDSAEDRTRIEMLVRVVREGGLAVPAGIWKSPPEAA